MYKRTVVELAIRKHKTNPIFLHKIIYLLHFICHENFTNLINLQKSGTFQQFMNRSDFLLDVVSKLDFWRDAHDVSYIRNVSTSKFTGHVQVVDRLLNALKKVNGEASQLKRTIHDLQKHTQKKTSLMKEMSKRPSEINDGRRHANQSSLAIEQPAFSATEKWSKFERLDYPNISLERCDFTEIFNWPNSSQLQVNFFFNYSAFNEIEHMSSFIEIF